uniref:Putative DNA binding, helix-turn-helix domain containing protein n=1 Tax=viral metagenome TaxID=1070528 RepID=A0A6M3LSQ8_9ZZZZ
MRSMKNKNKKLKQVEIARLAGVSESFLSEIISNKKRPSWATAIKLSKATKTPIDLWMGGTTKKIRKHIG